VRATPNATTGPVDRPPTEAEATPADWSTTRAHPHNNWTNRRGPVSFSRGFESAPFSFTV
jgi:hypothetical protein